ncbi:alpha/beta-hydrolase [Schizophyllum commune Loenen D]|nr:alpha/beta-hydrolase [Schizophyllum commune Loenen D]
MVTYTSSARQPRDVHDACGALAVLNTARALRIYGGGFYQGSTSQYNMTNLVEQSIERGTPVMVVASNYRLGPLSFPQGNEAQDDGVLNLGILDAKVALEWAQENIGAFGGDDSKVTVFGLSAGSIIISILMLDPDFSQLARAAILESGWAATLPLKYPTDNEDAWRSFVRGIPDCVSTIDNSTTLDCLRGLDNSSALLANINPQDAYEASLFPFGPVIDGPGGVVPDLPSTLYAQGNYTLLPTISGNVLDEGTLFVPNPNANLTTDTIVDVFIKNFSTPLIDAEVFSSSISKVVSLYPEDPFVGSPYGTGNETFGLHPGYKRIASLVGDINFDTLRRGWAQMSASAGVPTYKFIFSQRQPGFPPALGVPHGSNYAFQFGTEEPADPTLATAIMDYWLSFATSLDPNDGLGTERPNWPVYDGSNEVLLQLQDDNITTIPDDYRKEQIDFVLENPLVLHH